MTTLIEPYTKEEHEIIWEIVTEKLDKYEHTPFLPCEFKDAIEGTKSMKEIQRKAFENMQI